MTALGELTVGDYLTARVFSYHISNPARQFVNTYEFRVNSVTVEEADLLGLAATLGDFHAAMALDICRIDRAVISTYEAEEGSYDPFSFINIPLGVLGVRTGVGDPLPANVVLYLKRAVTTGRTGKMHLRLSLGETEIVAPAGVAQLANPGGMQDILNTALEESGMDAYLADTAGASQFQMALVSTFGDPPALGHRLVRNLAAGGVRVTDYNHKWFDVS